MGCGSSTLAKDGNEKVRCSTLTAFGICMALPGQIGGVPWCPCQRRSLPRRRARPLEEPPPRAARRPRCWERGCRCAYRAAQRPGHGACCADSDVGLRLQDVSSEYTLGKVLGRGQFGTTRLAEDKKSGKVLACKSIAKRKLTCAAAQAAAREM